MATVARSRSGASERAMPQTALATTATAATFSPWSQPASATPSRWRPNANATRAMAEGSVNPSQAAMAPGSPARKIPIATPTWLLVGPGKNWQSATRSA